MLAACAIAQAYAAMRVGEALWARARAEHHQNAPDPTSCGEISAACADTLQEAETWLRTALDLGVSPILDMSSLPMQSCSVKMSAQINLACVVFLKGEEDKAVMLLSQHLQDWVDVGSHGCAGCFQVRGEDAPMLSCDGCRVARSVYAAIPSLCVTNCHACRAVADDREA